MSLLSCIAGGVLIVGVWLFCVALHKMKQAKEPTFQHEHIWEPWEVDSDVERHGTNDDGTKFRTRRQITQHRTCTTCGLHEYKNDEVYYL